MLLPGEGYEELKRHLHIGSLIGGKVWLLDPVLKIFGVVILAAAVAGLVWSWWTFHSVTLLTVGSLGLLGGALALSAIFPHIMRLVQYRKTVRDVGLRGLLGVVLALGFKVHRRFFDRRFLKLGSLCRHARNRPSVDDAGRVC